MTVTVDLLLVRFNFNISRIEGLVALYRRLIDGVQDGDAMACDDVLRAAVVLLHAALEDVLRSVEEEILPEGHPEHLKGIGIPLEADGSDPRTRADKVTLVQLARHRGRTVDDLIRHAVEAHLERRSYNNIWELQRFEERTSLVIEWPDEHRTAILAMMKRRHLIAHRADQNPDGRPWLFPLDAEIVERWEQAVRWYGRRVLDARRRER